MEAKDYLAYIVQEIHTCVVATVDDEGLPVTAAIDMMDSDEIGLYFLTAKGKGFYDRLVRRGYIALTAVKGRDTMSSVAVSVRGKVRELGFAKIPELLEKNPYMYRIYPTDESRQALTVFLKNRSNGRPSLLAAFRKRRRVTELRMPVSVAADAQRFVRRAVSCVIRSLSSSSRIIVCTAGTAWRSALQARWKNAAAAGNDCRLMTDQRSLGGTST